MKKKNYGRIQRQIWRQTTRKKGRIFYEAMLKGESAVINQIASTRKDLQGMCRFINNAKVNLKSLMEENILICKSQIKKTEHYLVLHDTSNLNFENHSGKLRMRDKDIGPTAHKDSKRVGFMIHPSLVVDSNTGFAKGYSNIKIWNREFGQEEKNKKLDKKQQPIEDKESYKWLEGIQSSNWLCNQSEHVTHVMDRESDIYELFTQPREKNEDWIVRVYQNRSLENEEERIKDYLSKQPLRCSLQLKVKGNKNRRGRTAKLGLKYSKVKVKRPSKGLKTLPSYVEVNVVMVEECESSVPSGDSPIRWILYTTHEIESIEDALQIVDWYKKRWIIEELFSTLKTRGLCIEDSQLETGIGLKKLTVIALQAALQILQLVKERDGQYKESATLIFSIKEIVFVKALIKTLEGKTEKQKNHFKENSLAWVGWSIARLGGWKGYKSESPPGPKTMKRGLFKFRILFEGWTLANNLEST